MNSLRLVAITAATMVHVSSLPRWSLDASWPVGMPPEADWISAAAVEHRPNGTVLHVSQRAGTSIQPILVFEVASGKLVEGYGNDTVSFNSDAQTWGGHGIYSQSLAGGGSGVWVADIQDHTAKFYRHNDITRAVGTRNEEGSSLDPLQFGGVADVACGPPGSKHDGSCFISDGDGGVNNRVVGLDAKDNVLWAAGGTAADTADFHSPHSIAYHPRTGVLFVADRDNNRTVLLSADDGKVLSYWTCPELTDQKMGTIWAVRTWTSPEHGDLLIAALNNQPQDGNNQRVAVFDLASLHSQPSTDDCKVLTTFEVEPTACRTPHEIDVDVLTGDLYLACVTTDPGPSMLQRYILN